MVSGDFVEVYIIEVKFCKHIMDLFTQGYLRLDMLSLLHAYFLQARGSKVLSPMITSVLSESIERSVLSGVHVKCCSPSIEIFLAFSRFQY